MDPIIHVLDLNYVSLYVERFQDAREFYTGIFGPPGYEEGSDELCGWKMGATWLTLLSARPAGAVGDPRGCEFGVQVATPVEVDLLFDRLVERGAQACRPPADTWMYERMRFACVDDPFGVRIDVYAVLPDRESKTPSGA